MGTWEAIRYSARFVLIILAALGIITLLESVLPEWAMLVVLLLAGWAFLVGILRNSR